MNARAIATVFVCLAVVFAGCAGMLDSAKEQARDAAEGAVNDALNDSGVDGVLNDSRVDDLADMPANMTMIGFGFDRPAKYTYEIAVGQGNLRSTSGREVRGQLVVDVREVTEGNATLSTRYELGGETFEATFSGTQEDVAVEFATVSRSTNTSPGMRALIAHTNLAATVGMSLYLGGYVTPLVDAQSRLSEGGTVTYDTGTDSYAGVECSVSVLKVNGTPTAESCVSTDLGLPVYVVLYDENGTPDTWLKLVEYET